MSWKQKPQEFNKHYCLVWSFRNHHKGVLGCSLWDGVLSSLDLAEELLRYAVVKGELAVEHGEQDHAKSPHVTGFTAVRPTCGQSDRSTGSAGQTHRNFQIIFFKKKTKHWHQTIHKHLLLFCGHGRFCPMTQGWSTFQQVEFPSTGLIINNASKNKQKWQLQVNLFSPKFSSTLPILKKRKSAFYN